MWPWRVKMPTQNLLRLLLLLMLVMRIVLITGCCRFGSWGLVIKLTFCSDFEHTVWSRFFNWSSGKILKLKFGQSFAADGWLRLWSLILVEILKLELVKILKLKFGHYFATDAWLWLWSFVEMLMFGRDFEVGACSRFWRCLIKICDMT